MSNDNPVMMPEEKYWWYSDAGTEMNEFLTTLIELGMIEGAALGIARLVIDQGVESLTPRQTTVFDQHVIQPHAIRSCPRCGQEIRWSEMLHQEGWCAYCNNLLHKND